MSPDGAAAGAAQHMAARAPRASGSRALAEAARLAVRPGIRPEQVTTATPRTLRTINDRAALALLLRHGALSRSQLAEMTGLSKPTAAQLLSRLSDDGLIVERGRTSGAPGPTARLYALNDAVAYVGAVDVQEARLTAAVADISGRVLAAVDADIDFTSDSDPVPVVKRTVADACRRARVRLRDLDHLVLGVPAAHDVASDSLTFATHIPGWAAPDVLRRLRAALRIELVVENDVNLAAVWERKHGGTRGAAGFALLWVSQGIGLAIDLGGVLYGGATGGAGEIGYMRLGMRPADDGIGPPTFDDLVGAPAVARLARSHGFGGEATEAVTAARLDLARGMPFLSELARRLAGGLAPIVAVLDPPVVVLAGSTCTAGGEILVHLIADELRAISPFETPLTLTAADGSPVLRGGLDAALTRIRETVLGLSEEPAPGQPQRSDRP